MNIFCEEIRGTLSNFARIVLLYLVSIYVVSVSFYQNFSNELTAAVTKNAARTSGVQKDMSAIPAEASRPYVFMVSEKDFSAKFAEEPNVSAASSDFSARAAEYRSDIHKDIIKKTSKQFINIATLGFFGLLDSLVNTANSVNKITVQSCSKDSHTEENFKDRND